MAGLRLDIREDAIKPTKSGVTPIVPGDPAKSAIIQRIFAESPAKIMPPKHAHKELTQAQKDTIKQWVSEGAGYEGHWAYEPVRKPSPLALSDASLVRNPIDTFVQDRLAQEKLKPSPEADRRTLLRRVTLDLTGVPPTPEEVKAFLEDKSPDAYERIVDRLLASPRHAEMQTLRWLDAVRYADTAGFHGDNPWPAWPYRDYVLQSFAANKPFDQFTREQIAGDLLPDATREQKVASAFNRLNRASAEGGIQPKEYLAKYGADRVRTISTVWMGATVGCAECHDHKFDPYLAKDFYSMKAFFSDIKETGLIPDRGAKAWGTKLQLPTDAQEQQLAKLDEEIAAVRKELQATAKKLQEKRWDWEGQTLAAHKAGKLAWKYQQPLSARSANGAELTIHKDDQLDSSFYLAGSVYSEKGKKSPGLIVASGPNPDNETYTVRVQPGAGTWTAIGIDVQQDESLPGNRVSRGADRFVVTEVEAEIAEGPDQRKLGFILANSTEFGEPVEHTAMAAIDGKADTGWAVSFGEHRNPFLALRFDKPLAASADTVITLRLRHDSLFRSAVIGRFRVAMSDAQYAAPETGDSNQKRRLAAKFPELSILAIAADQGIPPQVLRAMETEESERTEEQQEQVVNFYLWSQGLTVPLAKLEAQRTMLMAAIPSVITTERTRPRQTRILPRGNFLDETGAIVDPAIPVVFGKVPAPEGKATRLDLANWLVSKDNPLTPRVYANRVWRQYFGTGLSKVLEDLGSQGEWPTHPELLDWLAAEFRESWDTRKLTRAIVTSHTYRQASLSTAAMEEKDPYNRLLARQSRFRVDAEVVHDIALAVSGLLKEKVGGPSVKPLQPEGYYGALNFPKREYSASRGDDLHRRALYTHWQRTFLHPSLAAFDAPGREECTVNRVNSNTPLQALVLLNDPIYVGAAEAFAKQIEANGKDLNARLDWAFARALSRPPDKVERRILSDLHKKYLARHKNDEAGATATVARAILNLHETITRN